MPSAASASAMLGKRARSTGPQVQAHRPRALLAQPLLDGQRHLVARRQLVHEPLAAGVQQQRALAAHRLGDQEAVARAVADQRGGVELHELQVGQAGARRVGQRQPDADRAGRVRRARPQRRRAARGQHGAPGRHGQRPGLRARGHAHAAAVLHQQPGRGGVLHHPDALVAGGERRQLARDPPAGGRSAGVHDPARRVPALQAQRQRAAAVGVEAHAHALEVADAVGRVPAEHVDRARAGPRRGPPRCVSAAWRAALSSTASAAAMPPWAQ